jgi:hypothetical protein
MMLNVKVHHPSTTKINDKDNIPTSTSSDGGGSSDGNGYNDVGGFNDGNRYGDFENARPRSGFAPKQVGTWALGEGISECGRKWLIGGEE